MSLKQNKPNGVHLSLPFPDAILNPNKHVHWSRKDRARQSLREACFFLTKQRGWELDASRRYRCVLVFCPPDHRTRDLDNLLSAMKSGLDGMCRALGINDRKLKPEPDWGPVVEGGKVEVTLVELTAAENSV